jgi:hypothetical protein
MPEPHPHSILTPPERGLHVQERVEWDKILEASVKAYENCAPRVDF